MTEQPTPTTKVEVPGIQQWKADLWEINREIKSLLMLSNVKTVEGLVAYVSWHQSREFEAILTPEEYDHFGEAMSTLAALLPSESQIEVVKKRTEELTVKRATLNQIKAMFE